MKVFKLTFAGAVASALLVPALSMAQAGATAGSSGWDGGSHSAAAQASAVERLLREGPPLDTMPSSATGEPREQVRSKMLGAEGRSASGQISAAERLLREGPPLDTMPSVATGKTRDQVRNELLSMSDTERQQMNGLHRN